MKCSNCGELDHSIYYLDDDGNPKFKCDKIGCLVYPDEIRCQSDSDDEGYNKNDNTKS